MLAVVRSVAVVDRTGELQYALRGCDVDVLDLRAGDLDVEPPDVDVLLVGAREFSGAGLRRIARWHRLQPAGVVVAHLDSMLPIDRATLRAAGVEHVVRGRLTPAKLRTALLHADVALAELVTAAGRRHGELFEDEWTEADSSVEGADEPDSVDELEELYNEQPYDADDIASDATDEDAEAPRAKLLTVASATGGCGKTFFATNVASLFARAGAKVLLIDLDLQFGEVAAALQVQHAYSLYDGLYNTSGERLPVTAMREHLDALVHHHSLGFDVLTAPRDPILADFVGARDAMTLLDAVLPRYDIVIADTPPSLNDVVIAALDRSDAVSVLATLDVPSLRNLTAFLDVLRRLNLDDERIRLVLNKADRDVGVTTEQANDAFDGRFGTVLPVDRAVSRSVNLGTTVAVHEPRAKVSRALVPAVATLAAEFGLDKSAIAPEPVARRTAPTRSFGAMFRRLLSGGSA
ncbi:MAG: AAA family ATPase [Frankiales bacterium]|nr:AAA family ATPase [Frankiales bacterium]